MCVVRAEERWSADVVSCEEIKLLVIVVVIVCCCICALFTFPEVFFDQGTQRGEMQMQKKHVREGFREWISYAYYCRWVHYVA